MYVEKVKKEILEKFKESESVVKQVEGQFKDLNEEILSRIDNKKYVEIPDFNLLKKSTLQLNDKLIQLSSTVET